MATATQAETQLIKLMQDAQKLIKNQEIESCSQWIDREVNKVKKLQEQIDRLQKTPGIPAKLFNEAREMSDDLHRFIEQLRSFKQNMARNGRQVVINNYEDATKSGWLRDGNYNIEYKAPF